MAEFCRECSIELFGEDFRELAGLSAEKDTAAGLFPEVICEGCGFVQVDHNGVCIGGGACQRKHTYPPHTTGSKEDHE